MFQPGVWDVIKIPVTISEFHTKILAQNSNDILSLQQYSQWQQIDPKPISPTECIGYIKPIFLSGEDTVENMERSDLDVYLYLCGQIRQQIKDLPAGTVIMNVTFHE